VLAKERRGRGAKEIFLCSPAPLHLCTPGLITLTEVIAAAMRFLCSDDAASINGARIPIYGAV
jgi:hypothetical protein